MKKAHFWIVYITVNGIKELSDIAYRTRQDALDQAVLDVCMNYRDSKYIDDPYIGFYVVDDRNEPLE